VTVFRLMLAIAPAERQTPSVLDPHGRGARVIAREMWIQWGFATLTFAIVVAAIVVAVVRSRQPDDADDGRGLAWIVGGGIVFPVVVLTILFVVSVNDVAAIMKPPAKPLVKVQVIGHRWWWEVRYPDTGIETANQIAVPVGTTVEVDVSSGDVIHSFWVPQLQRKIDAIPGQIGHTWLTVGRAGTYRGDCAEFCGLEHARMQLVVQAMPQARYREWIAAMRKPAPPARDASERTGLHVFLTSTCATCHTIRGTGAGGDFAPDLTHVASRPDLAGAILPNTRGNLGGWIMDPQHVKPGALMPPGSLSGPQLQALLDYLESLE
jgi:cytochrome c oxidase subunit 2